MMPSIDPASRGDEAVRRATPRDTAADTARRFADLLAGAPVPAAPRQPGEPSLPDRGRGETRATHARLFNQDGFFGLAQTVPAALPARAVEAIEQEVTAVERSGIVAAPEAASAVMDGGPAATAGRTGSTPLSPRSHPAALHHARPSHAIAAAPASRPTVAPRPGAATPPRRPGHAAAPARRPLPQPNATVAVAVAVHAASHGIEVAAQVAGIDERDRAAIADEIAALLSAHGYAPARVSVTAPAPRATRRDDR